MDFDPTFDELFDTQGDPVSRRSRRTHLEDDLDDPDRDDLTEVTSLHAVLEDPEDLDASADDEDEPTYEEASDEEIEESESLDPVTFGTGKGGFERDPFEAFVGQAKKYGNMTFDEIDRQVELLQSDDDSVKADAEDCLVKHSIRWIVRCLQRCAGSHIMNRAGEERNNALSVGLDGFLAGLRKYDPEKALKRGMSGHKKSILPYTEYWIRKYYEEDRALKMGLNTDAAHDRNRIMKAQSRLRAKKEQQKHAPAPKAGGKRGRVIRGEPTTLELQEFLHDEAASRLAKKELGRGADPDAIEELAAVYREEVRASRQTAWEELAAQELLDETGESPTDDAIAERVEEYRTQHRVVDYDLSKDLRRAGAYTLDRITTLPQHSTSPQSMDAPATGEDEDGPTIGEYLESRSEGADEVISQDELGRALSRRLASVLGRRNRRLVRERHGFFTEQGDARFHPSNPEELMYWLGRSSRDTVSAIETQVERSLRGEVLADPDALIPDGLDFSVNSVRALHERLRKARESEQKARHLSSSEESSQSRTILNVARTEVSGVRADLDLLLDKIRKSTDFRHFLKVQKVEGVENGRVECPLEESPSGKTVLVNERGFRCAGCGEEGDIFRWLEAQGLTDEERDVAAARAAIALPPTLEEDNKKVVVIQDPARRKRLVTL